MKFKYTARNRLGEMESSVLEAASRAEAIQSLRAKSLTPVSLTEQGSEIFESNSGGLKRWLEQSMEKKASAQDIALFFRQLSISVTAGVALRDALETLGEEMDKSNLRVAVLRAVNDLGGGMRLAAALEKNNVGRVFSQLSIGLVQVAEETGRMGETLSELADYLEKMDETKKEIKGKLSYPTFMLCAFVGIMLFATFYLFPMFEKNFSSLGSALPPLTQTVFKLNRISLKVSPYAIGLLAAVVTGLILFRRTPPGRMAFDATLLKLPLIGPLIYKTSVSRFSRTLAITSNGGVPLINGLTISATVVANRCIQKSLAETRDSITNGSTFGKSIRATKTFTGLVVRMIEVGEESGQLPFVLNKVSQVYETEVNRSINKLTTMIEPIIIVLFGVFVTVMVLALYMPVFSMSGNMK
jgi:type II secretory pathway component PulF